MRILILGYKSFVANGLYEKFKSKGLEVDCFSRGNYGKTNDLFCNDNYIDEICFTDSYYTNRDWVINSNKFSQQMIRAV